MGVIFYLIMILVYMYLLWVGTIVYRQSILEGEGRNKTIGMSTSETIPHQSHNEYKKNHYRSKYCLQHGDLAYTEQQDIKSPNMTSVKQFKQENQQYNHQKKERNKKRL